MAVSEQTPANSSTGNGVTTVFPYTFKILAQGDIEVAVDGVVKTLTTHYTLSGVGDDAGGNVTFLTAPAADTVVTRRRDMAYVRTTDYQYQGDLPNDVLNADQDAPVLMLQQLSEQVGRSLKAPIGESEPSALPSVADRASMFLAFDAAGNPIASSGTGADAGLRTDLAVAATGSGLVGYTPTSTGVAGTVKSFLESLWSTGAAAGAALIRYIQSGTGAIARAIQDKLRELPSAEDFGAVGDGATDDATPLLNAANAAVAAGRTLSLNGVKTYAISSLALPAGLQMNTNGATFKAHATTTSNSPLITIAANVRVFGPLKIVIPTAMRRDRTIAVQGADCVFGDIDVSSVDQQANTTDNDDAAVRFQSAHNVCFGRLRVDKFDRAVQFLSCDNPSGGSFDITSYTRAVLLENTRVLRMAKGGWIRTASPNAIYTPGHVGVLMSASTDDATREIYIPGLLIEDSGEHGMRIGGPARISEVALPGLHTKNTGGSGLKILGTDSGTPTSRNRNISFHGAIFEDCGTGAYTTNMCGVLAMYCDGVYGDNIVVRKQGKLYSAHTGVRVAACADLRITGDFGAAEFDGAWLDGSLGDIDRVHIGGISRSNGRDGYRLTAGTNTMRRLTTDLNCDSNSAFGFNISIGGGTLVDSLFQFKVYNNISGAGACDNASASLNVFGLVGATPLSGITASNGSRWSDGTTLNIWKAGAAAAL